LPFKAVYGRDPPSLRTYSPGEARLPAVDAQLKERDEFLGEIRDRLEQAQQHLKEYYDRKHQPVDFEVGQWVCQRLLHRPMAPLEVKGCDKLGPCYFRPFQISEKIGTVAYRLRLPTGVCIHDVFHVALLKRFFSEPPQAPPALPSLHHGRVCVQPERVQVLLGAGAA
jgi:hypothetical protein